MFSSDEPIYTWTYLDDLYIAINTPKWALAICRKMCVEICTVSTYDKCLLKYFNVQR